jgi:hypothetical protein
VVRHLNATRLLQLPLQADIMRVQQVKQHRVTKLGYEAAGYFDG